MSARSHDLFLTIVNTSGGYKTRRGLGRGERVRGERAGESWLHVALNGAAQYRRQFGGTFSIGELAEVANRLAAYYLRAAKEEVEGGL